MLKANLYPFIINSQIAHFSLIHANSIISADVETSSFSRQLIDRLKSEAHPLCSCLSCFSPVSGKRSCFRAPYLGEILDWVVRVYFFDYISLLFPRSKMLANEDDTFIGNSEAGFLWMLSFVWFYLDLNLPTWQNIQRTEPCSCSPSLLPSTISHRRFG